MFIPTENVTVANETKTPLPKIIEADGSVNNDYMKDLSDWFDKSFGLRNFLIGTQHRVVAAIFGESDEKKVVLGKDGWLFYEETLDDYMGTNLMTEREIYSAVRTLELADEYARANGMEFCFVPVPNKNSLYPEKMPDLYPRFSGKSNMDLIVQALLKGKVKSIDLKTVFEKEKVLYRATDSHWTTEGAGLASDCILDALGKNHKKIYGSETLLKDNGAGDLYEMLYIWGSDYDKDVVYKDKHSFEYERPIRSFEDNFINTSCAEKDGRLYMFRDSFGNTLHPFVADEFGHCTFSRILPYNLVSAKNDNADFAVLEVVERNIKRIITEGMVFPAPVRETKDAHLTDVTPSTELDVFDDGLAEDCVRLEGTVGEKIGIRDNIIIVSDGVSYEATPGGNDTFYAYIPKTDKNKISIFLMR